MTKMEYDVVFYILRGQPPHKAHIETIQMARKKGMRVVVVIGSANEPRTYFRNPFTAEERKAMIAEALLDDGDHTGVYYVAVENKAHSDQQWAMDVYEAGQNLIGDLSKLKVGKIGFKKDANVERDLNLFPTWEYIETPQFEPINATQVREVFFNPTMPLSFLKGVLHRTTLDYLHGFRSSEEYAQLLREKKYIEDYQKQYASLPYAPTFVTADAVVFQSGHVLMIERKAEPGKGLWALPGGFLNAKTDASLEDAAIRELFEETGIELARKPETTEKILRKNIKNVKVFDAVDRSSRGRTITHAFNIVLDDGEWNLPKVKGSDDAAVAKWIPIVDLRRETIFEDHADIINYFLGKL